MTALLTMFPPEAIREAEALLAVCRGRRLKIASAESCSGGLLAALITAIPGSSDVFERGFVTYSNEAKTELLAVGRAAILQYGAVSRQVALAMAEGALEHSAADLAAAITGVAGPGGGTAGKPVGLVHVVAARRSAPPMRSRLVLGSLDRHGIRLGSVMVALKLLNAQAAT